MADTASETPVVYTKLADHHLDYGAPIASASELDLDAIDLSDNELWRRHAYWDRFERMRAEDPVHYCEHSPFGPFWSITKYQDIMEIDTNHQVFSSDAHLGGIVIADMDDDFIMPMFIAMDPPKHDIQRKTVQPIVGPNNLKNFESLIRERTNIVLDSLPVGEEFDWVDTVSIELTTMMLATLFDFPFDDRRKLTRWSDVATAGRQPSEICPGGEEQRRQELLECLMYFTELWNQRVNLTEPGNDLVSMLAHGEATRDMPPMEYLGNLVLLIVGGNDTTRNSMTGSVLGLNEFPEQYELLKQKPELIPDMVSEIIRWQTPLAHMRRTALQDFEFRGKLIKKGDKVAMWYASGNRDEDKFPERANEIWIERPRVRSHMSFGFGIHRCVGNRLAELQLKILWEELLARYSHIEVIGEPKRTPSFFVKGYTEMIVKLHA